MRWMITLLVKINADLSNFLSITNKTTVSSTSSGLALHVKSDRGSVKYL